MAGRLLVCLVTRVGRSSIRSAKTVRVFCQLQETLSVLEGLTNAWSSIVIYSGYFTHDSNHHRYNTIGYLLSTFSFLILQQRWPREKESNYKTTQLVFQPSNNFLKLSNLLISHTLGVLPFYTKPTLCLKAYVPVYTASTMYLRARDWSVYLELLNKSSQPVV